MTKPHPKPHPKPHAPKPTPAESWSALTTTVKLSTTPPGPVAWIAGVTFTLAGAAILVADYALAFHLKQLPHTLNFVVGVAFLSIGLLIPFGRYVFPTLQNASIVFGPYIPVIGGRRSGDPKDGAP